MDKASSKRMAKMAGRVLSKGPYSLTLQEALETLSSFAGCILAQYEKDQLESITPEGPTHDPAADKAGKKSEVRFTK